MAKESVLPTQQTMTIIEIPLRMEQFAKDSGGDTLKSVLGFARSSPSTPPAMVETYTCNGLSITEAQYKDTLAKAIAKVKHMEEGVLSHDFKSGEGPYNRPPFELRTNPPFISDILFYHSGYDNLVTGLDENFDIKCPPIASLKAGGGRTQG